MRSRPTLPPHRSLPALLLAALLLPLIAACGSPNPAPAAVPINRPPAVTTAPAAPAATAAPVTAAPAAAAPPDVARAPGAAAEAASGSAGSVGIAPLPTAVPAVVQQPQPVADQQQAGTPLKAGEVDDNADFNSYLQYLYAYSGLPVRPVDVTERYLLTIVNDQQQPVLDARVRVFDGQQLLFVGRTYAGGRTIVHPRALGAFGNSQAFRVQIDKGNSSAEATLTRGQGIEHTFVLPGAEAAPARTKLDVLFLLDATGSMGDEIGRIQQTIVSIADRIAALPQQPELRLGLVAYRDRGDEFVTRIYDFTPSVQEFQRTLLTVRAEGGGDDPESLNEALHQAVQGVNWASDALRLTFLVADAPPHLDYAQDFDYVQETRVAVARGVKIYPIAASNSDDQAEYVFRQVAQQTLASFIFLTYQPGQNTGAPGDTTQHNVDPAAFTVERLDDLVVQVVRRELAQVTAAG